MVTQINPAIQFIERSMRLVNGLENVVDNAWRLTERILNKHTELAHKKMKKLIQKLPAHSNPDLASQGFVDFKSGIGIRAQNRFKRELSLIYREWRRNIIRDLGMPDLNQEMDSWDISLGRFDHRGGRFLQRIRDEVIRKAHQMMSILDPHVEESVLEAREIKVKNLGMISARITGRGLPKGSTSHSRSTSIILRGLKDVIKDQEKAMLENALRGLDQLPRNHANNLYDAMTGLTLRDSLNAIADQFSVGEMSKKQLKLSIQTHIRAMMRRIAGETANQKSKKALQYFIQVPATREKDLKKGLSKTALERALEITSVDKLLSSSNSSGDSLGLFPGDKTLPIPIPDSLIDAAREAAKEGKDSLFLKLAKRSKDV